MGNFFEFFKQAPQIIAEAAKKPLGIVALVILALSVLAFVFFADAPVSVRVGIFIVLVLGFGLFAFAAMRRMPDVRKVNPVLAKDKTEVLPGDAVEKPEPEKWPRLSPDAISTANLPRTGEHLFGRDSIIFELRHLFWLEYSMQESLKQVAGSLDNPTYQELSKVQSQQTLQLGKIMEEKL